MSAATTPATPATAKPFPVAVIVAQRVEFARQGRDLRAAAFAEVAQVGGERFDCRPVERDMM